MGRLLYHHRQRRQRKKPLTSQSETVYQNGVMAKPRKHNGASTNKSSTPQKPSNIISNIGIVVASCIIAAGIVMIKYQSAQDKDSNKTSRPFSPAVPQTESGGWRQDDVDANEYSSEICTIDRIFHYEITDETFEKHYRYKRPLIVMFDKGAKEWTDIERWTLSRLKKDYGEWEIVSGNAREIVRRGGSGYVPSTFSHYVDKLMTSRDEIGEPLYVFDRKFYNDSDLPSTIRPPSFLKVQDGVDDSIFFLGPSGSGVSFHHHADAWNGVIFGKKRWFLYRPSKTPPGGVYPGLTTLQWLDKLYPRLEDTEKPGECVQNAGEILYVPEGMYHATVNIGDTIAVGIQKKQAATETEKLFYKDLKLTKKLAQTTDGSEKANLMQKRKNVYSKLAKLLPDNSEIWMKLGALYKDMGELNKAYEGTLKALEIDPKFIVAMMNLAEVANQLGRSAEAEQLYQQVYELNPNLWDYYAKYGDFLLNHNRPQEAVGIYKRGTELEPNQMAFWHQLLLAQTRAGDDEGAKRTTAEMKRRMSA